jgi:thymidylate kinase
MVIICEGLDRTGKSTLQKNLLGWMCDQDIWPVETQHAMNIKANTANVQEASKQLYEHFFSRIEKCDTNIIFDRLHLGEVVYSPMYKNYDGHYVYDLEKAYLNDTAQGETFLFLLVDTPESILSRDDGDGWSSDLNKMYQERNAFIDAYNKSNIINKKLIEIKDYDYDTDKVFYSVVEFISQRMIYD